MIKKEYITEVTEYESITELPKADKTLAELAIKSAKNAYAPYSNLKVGASILLENNEIISGNNQENGAYPAGMCAERVALFYANSKFNNIAPKSIAICAFHNNNTVTDTPITPCGSCRQALLETEIRFNKPIRIIMIGKNKIIISENILQLVPIHFQLNNHK